MSATPAVDAAFVALAPVAAGAALASVRQPSLALAARAALLAAAATSLRWAFAGAAGVAALQLALATTAAAVLVLEPSFFRGMDGDGTRRLRRAAPLVLAWFALALRVLLMTRWPSSAAPGSSVWWAAAGVVPDLVFGATMLALALFGAASRASVGGVALAIPIAGSGAATVLVALSCTPTPSAGALAQLAVAAVVSSWVLPAAALAMVRGAPDGHGAAAPLPPGFATEVSTVVAGMALALLVGTW